MVKKLMKHELFALFRVLVFFAAAVVAFAVIGRLLVAVNLSGMEGAEQFTVITLLIIFFYIITIFALIVAAWALGISRFYKVFFTGEGYMTLSLPATPVQIITAKLLSALIAMLFASAVSVLSAVLFLVGWNAEVMQIIGELFGEIGHLLGEVAAEEPLLFTEYILFMLVSIPFSLLIVYAILSVGQLFTRRRKGLTLLLAFGTYVAWNILSVVAFNPILMAASMTSPHLEIWLRIVFIAAVDVGCFFLVRHILKNKVNLIV